MDWLIISKICYCNIIHTVYQNLVTFLFEKEKLKSVYYVFMCVHANDCAATLSENVIIFHVLQRIFFFNWHTYKKSFVKNLATSKTCLILMCILKILIF